MQIKLFEQMVLVKNKRRLPYVEAQSKRWTLVIIIKKKVWHGVY